MPMASHTNNSIIALLGLRSPAIAGTRQSSVKFATNHLLDQPANTVTDPGLDRIKPIVEKMGVTLDRRMRKLRCGGNIFHGVVSCPALQRQVIRG
jgi:hypothetical protein